MAAGEGYGTALLSQVARSVIGVEIDAATVGAAGREFGRGNLRYLCADARSLPLPDACVDVVVSFETLEHFDRQDHFLDECRRVLRPGGLLIISTPDKAVYSAPGAPPNPFHVRELDRPEFEELLCARFANCAIATQRPLIGSAILGEGRLAPRVFDAEPDDRFAAAAHLTRAPYLIAFASDADLPSPVASLLISRDDLDTDLAMRREAEAQARDALARAADAAAALADSQAGATEAATRAAEAEARLADAAMRLAEAESRLAEAGARAAGAERGLADAAVRAAETESRLAEAEARAANAVAQRAAAEARAAELAMQFHAFEASLAGRAARRVQHWAARRPRAMRLLRRATLLGWWTLRGQLPMRVGLWLRHRRRLREIGAPKPEADTDIGRSREAPRPETCAKLPLPSDIRLPPASATPLVSVIIPTYGQVGFTLRCLASIAAAPPRAGIEVIVAEDASGDPAIASLREVTGITLRENAANLGFLRSCNAAAATARGRFLLFLNNDTELLPGAIDALVELAQARPDAGLVGARLVYPDGRLQEAGGIVWQDASAWNYGRFDDPRRPEFNYVREVDYVSGAAILVRRDVFEQLGGFDDIFAPAYCEDTDLAFRIRAIGLKTLYQPRAVVVHHEGISHGTDTTSGVKAYQVRNQAVMRDRWAGVLLAEHFPNGQQVLRARDRAHGRPVALVIDHKVVEPDRDAGSRTTLEHMQALLRAGWVVKFWPDNGYPTPGYTEALQDLGIEVLHGPWSGSFADWIAANGGQIDDVILNRPTLETDYLSLIRASSHARVAYYGHDLHFARMRREAEVTGIPETGRRAELMLSAELRLWAGSDVVLYPSEEEAAEVRRLAPGTDARVVLPFAFAEFPRRSVVPPPDGGILFVAGFAHRPNVDAAVWLVREILPLVRQVRPGVGLVLAGSHPTTEVTALAGNGVEVTGMLSVEDLAARYAAARVAVVPLCFGAGVKLKVVEALQQGLPLVTTPVGAQGLPGLEQVLPVVEAPQAMAEALIRLLQDDAAWREQSARQSEFAEARFSREALGESLLSALTAPATGRAVLAA
ncbi:methyltransferase domain-containing protein [Paracraurococcus lichenis]|uniref:Glycosyltransferase n=1 Tax=Paracraurococcus lichenis TaxID=3064888 RepID=A0ABT9DXV1_9PROT|nr:glycosyltransferase [Paracraurococcus sp. LOR1-02]MDO9708727.1 glycosyltransferase [Paracraurococcus sp. LOR1-02]